MELRLLPLRFWGHEWRALPMPARRSPTPGSGSRPERGSNPRRASSQSDLMEQLRVFNTSSKVLLLLPSLLGPEIDTLGWHLILVCLRGRIPRYRGFRSGSSQEPGKHLWWLERPGFEAQLCSSYRTLGKFHTLSLSFPSHLIWVKRVYLVGCCED